VVRIWNKSATSFKVIDMIFCGEVLPVNRVPQDQAGKTIEGACNWLVNICNQRCGSRDGNFGYSATPWHYVWQWGSAGYRNRMSCCCCCCCRPGTWNMSRTVRGDRHGFSKIKRKTDTTADKRQSKQSVYPSTDNRMDCCKFSWNFNLTIAHIHCGEQRIVWSRNMLE